MQSHRGFATERVFLQRSQLAVITAQALHASMYTIAHLARASGALAIFVTLRAASCLHSERCEITEIANVTYPSNE